MPTIESRARNGAYAGVVLAILGSFTTASIIWGLLRPRYQATIIDDQGGLELNMVDNVEFTGFFWFVFTTGILAILLSARIHQRTLAYRGLSMLLWVTLWSLVGSILFARLGDLTTITVYRIPTATSNFSVGDVVPFVPLMNAGISGYAVAPADRRLVDPNRACAAPFRGPGMEIFLRPHEGPLHGLRLLQALPAGRGHPPSASRT